VLLSPVVGVFDVTSPFGARKDPITGKSAGHDGLDIGCPVGTRLQAVSAGVVYRLDIAEDGIWDGNGYAVWEELDPADSGIEDAVAVWLHMSSIAPALLGAPHRSVAGGKPIRVARGADLGLSGNTGRSTGPHLHFGMFVGGEPVDPALYIQGMKPYVGRPVLHNGSTGGHVIELQRALNLSGIGRALATDGIFGDGTEAAVRSFQTSRGLVSDGWVGPATWKALGL
jgi:hypothetical protein